MAELQTRIETELRQALKAKDALRLAVLRLLKSELQHELTKDGSSDMADDKVQTLIQRSIKKRRESAEQYRRADRDESAKREEAEIVVLEEYLPPAVAIDQIEAVISTTFESFGGSITPGDIGKVMGKIMAQFKGQNIDGNLVKELVQKRVSS